MERSTGDAVNVWKTGSIRVMRLGGFTIEVHLTFIFIILWGGWQGWVQSGRVEGVLFSIAAIFLLFLAVLAHELGHGLQARSYGLIVRRITLLPIGGLAQLETPPSLPRHELMIALAGPAVNFVFSLILAGIAFFLDLLPSEFSWYYNPGLDGLMMYWLVANVMLFAFNVVPAFPMDGGRMLRAGLALLVDYGQATRIAAWLGRLIAVGLGVYGIIGQDSVNPLLIIVAMVIFFGAHQEDIYVRRRRALVRVEAGDVCRKDTEFLEPWDEITPRLASQIFRQEQTIPVVLEGRLVGLVSFQNIARHSRQLDDSTATAAHIMQTDFPIVQPGDTLWVALQKMSHYQLTALPVQQAGSYVGMVDFIDIEQAWRYTRRNRQQEKK